MTMLFTRAGSPFQTWEASPFPVAPYRPMPLGIPLGQKARKATYSTDGIIALRIDAYNICHLVRIDSHCA